MQYTQLFFPSKRRNTTEEYARDYGYQPREVEHPSTFQKQFFEAFEAWEPIMAAGPAGELVIVCRQPAGRHTLVVWEIPHRPYREKMFLLLEELPDWYTDPDGRWGQAKAILRAASKLLGEPWQSPGADKQTLREVRELRNAFSQPENIRHWLGGRVRKMFQKARPYWKAPHPFRGPERQAWNVANLLALLGLQYGQATRGAAGITLEVPLYNGEQARVTCSGGDIRVATSLYGGASDTFQAKGLCPALTVGEEAS